jgi:hypothetical protein
MLRGLRFALLTALVAVPVAALEIAGVRLPDTTAVNGQQLQLNGAGVRKKVFFKIYVGALYVEQKSHDGARLVAAEGPRQMLMHFLYKEVEKEKLVEAWREGFANNSASNLAALRERLDTFCGWWPSMKAGERAVMTYVPGVGTKLEINGKEIGVVPGKDFADALLAVWVGAKPPTEDLKRGVLGQ